VLLIILGEHYKPYKESGQGNARRIAAGVVSMVKLNQAYSFAHHRWAEDTS
jgi:hypothetical protein